MTDGARIGMAILCRGRRIEDLQNGIDAVTLIDRHQLRMGYAPPLYQTGVIYRRERHGTLPGLERIQSAEETYLIGYGDCDDLAPWRAAELQLQGVDARAEVIRSPGVGYHVIVRMPSGRIEDPSARLGMLLPQEIGLGEQSEDVKRRRRRAFLDRAKQLLDIAKHAPQVEVARAALKEAKSIYSAVEDEETET